MLSRVTLIGSRRIANVNSSRVCGYHGNAPAPQTTMNDLPVPNGSWQAAYEAKQKKYNLHLAVGVLFATGTIVVAKASGLFHMNWSVPKLPEE